LSALILFIGAAAIGWWVDRRIYQIVTEDSIELAGVFVHSTIAPHLVELPSVNALTVSQAAHLQNLIANNVATGRYAVVNLWSPTGELVYSTLPGQGDQPQSTAGLRAAAAGEVYSYATDTIQGGSSQDAATRQGPYLESYFPVLGHDGATIAVIDLYQNLAALERSTLEVRLQTWAVVGSATALMYFLLYGIVRQGSETIESQQSALARSRRQIQQAAVRAAALNEAAMRRLGADLHDGPAQDLGLARMRIEPLRQDVARQLSSQGAEVLDLSAAAYDLQLIDTALQSSLQEIRNLASGLRLPELSDLDLSQAIRKAAGDYTRKTARAVTVTGPLDLSGGMALKSAAYRLVQESLNNGHQHGEPREQSVVYGVSGGMLQIDIKDDGKGFDPACERARGPRRQLGLAGLQERVEILGGWFEVQSAPGQGTRVRALLPLTGPNAEMEARE
jgi:signal transduction histidine kinase